MSSVDEMADKLALETIEAARRLDRPGLVDEIATILEASSSKMHEAYMAMIRAHLAEARARARLEELLAQAAAHPGGEAKAGPDGT